MRCPTCRQILPRPAPNAGKGWRPRDVDRLLFLARYMREKGVTADEAVFQLADIFGRTHDGLLSKLIKLGVMEP